MANQDFNLTGAIKVRPAEETDAANLHMYCFPEKTKKQVTEELKNDLKAENQTHRLVAESSGYPIGQVTVKQNVGNPEIAQVGNLAVAGPFRHFGVANYLIEAAQDAAAANGVKSLQIELSPSDTSVIQRYKDWGFSEKPVVVLEKILGESEPEAEEGIQVEADDTDEDAEDGASADDDEQPSLLDS